MVRLLLELRKLRKLRFSVGLRKPSSAKEFTELESFNPRWSLADLKPYPYFLCDSRLNMCAGRNGGWRCISRLEGF